MTTSKVVRVCRVDSASLRTGAAKPDSARRRHRGRTPPAQYADTRGEHQSIVPARSIGPDRCPNTTRGSGPRATTTPPGPRLDQTVYGAPPDGILGSARIPQQEKPVFTTHATRLAARPFREVTNVAPWMPPDRRGRAPRRTASGDGPEGRRRSGGDGGSPPGRDGRLRRRNPRSRRRRPAPVRRPGASERPVAGLPLPGNLVPGEGTRGGRPGEVPGGRDEGQGPDLEPGRLPAEGDRPLRGRARGRHE